MEFKQIQNLFGEDGQIKWTIVYGVCTAQKAFDWMEIRAVLEALSMKGIKELYIGTTKYILFLNVRSSQIKSIHFVGGGGAVRLWTGLPLLRCRDKKYLKAWREA